MLYTAPLTTHGHGSGEVRGGNCSQKAVWIQHLVLLLSNTITADVALRYPLGQPENQHR